MECKGCHWDPVMRVYRTNLNCPLHGTPRGKDPVDKHGLKADWDQQVTAADRKFLRRLRIEP